MTFPDKQSIGTIENHYGNLLAWKDENESCWWEIDGGPEEEIPEYLYEALTRFEKERQS